MNVQFSFSASSTSLSNNIPTERQLLTEHKSLNEDMKVTSSQSKDIISEQRQVGKVSIGEEHLIRMIDKAVKSLQGPQTTLDISIHEKTHEIMVKVLNKETGELIREVPPEKTLDLVANMMEIAGIIIDEKI